MSLFEFKWRDSSKEKAKQERSFIVSDIGGSLGHECSASHWAMVRHLALYRHWTVVNPWRMSWRPAAGATHGSNTEVMLVVGDDNLTVDFAF